MESRRILKEYEEIQKLNAQADKYGVTAEMVGSDMKHWKGVIRGPVCAN